jgi:hypothetical protein
MRPIRLMRFMRFIRLQFVSPAGVREMKRNVRRSRMASGEGRGGRGTEKTAIQRLVSGIFGIEMWVPRSALAGARAGA